MRKVWHAKTLLSVLFNIAITLKLHDVYLPIVNDVDINKAQRNSPFGAKQIKVCLNQMYIGKKGQYFYKK